MNNSLKLTENETALLAKIAKEDGTSPREVLHKAIFFLACEVDYTSNLAGMTK